MPYFDGVCGRAYYRRWPAEAPLAKVVFLHGFGEHSGHYHRLAAALNHQRVEMWALDHLGHGHSGGTPGVFPSVAELAANARTLIQLARTAEPDLPVILAGHSMGAVTAAFLAVHEPTTVHGFVLTGAPLDGLPPSAARVKNPVMSLDEAYLDALANDPLGFDTATAEPDLWKAVERCVPLLDAGFARIPSPILFINGEHDVFAPPRLTRRWADRAVDARSIEIAGGHHDILNDVQHRRVAQHIADFALARAAQRALAKDELPQAS
jgi:alpha-beta hydrolase superfamily lysophospholipase